MFPIYFITDLFWRSKNQCMYLCNDLSTFAMTQYQIERMAALEKFKF